jgi:hypothetical protein
MNEAGATFNRLSLLRQHLPSSEGETFTLGAHPFISESRPDVVLIVAYPNFPSTDSTLGSI